VTKKVFTASDDGRVDAIDIGLIPDSSRRTRKLAARGNHCHGVPYSTLDVRGSVVVWVVVAECHYVVVATRIGQAAAELSNYNTPFTRNQLPLPLKSRSLAVYMRILILLLLWRSIRSN